VDVVFPTVAHVIYLEIAVATLVKEISAVSAIVTHVLLMISVAVNYVILLQTHVQVVYQQVIVGVVLLLDSVVIMHLFLMHTAWLIHVAFLIISDVLVIISVVVEHVISPLKPVFLYTHNANTIFARGKRVCFKTDLENYARLYVNLCLPAHSDGSE
jgi:hypothetical protein